jgi:hypothetical protein
VPVTAPTRHIHLLLLLLLLLLLPPLNLAAQRLAVSAAAAETIITASRKNISQRGFLSFLSFTAFSFFRQFIALLLSLASEKRGPTTDKVVKNRSLLARPRPWLTA